MKKAALLVIALVLASIFLMSCSSSGVSQDQYKKATDDLAAAQAQVQSLQTQIQSLQSQVQAAQGDKATLADLQKKITQTKPYWDLFTTFYQIGIAGDTPSAAQILDMMSKIQGTGDTVLTSKLQAVISSGGGSKDTLDFINYIIGKVSDLLK